MNPLHAYLTPLDNVDNYKTLCNTLGLEEIIFTSMNVVAINRNIPFQLPTSPTEFTQKHREIESLLRRFQTVLGREGLLFELIEEVYRQLISQGLNLNAQTLLSSLRIRAKDEFFIRLTSDLVWTAEWEVNSESAHGPSTIICSVFKNGWGDIIPRHVVQYIRSSITLFQQKSFLTALTLMAISVEATLRDVLKTRGYTFIHGANKADIYDLTDANIEYDGSSGFRLNFVNPMPRLPQDLATSSAGITPVPVRVKREYKPRQRRVDLSLICPQYLLDHLSLDRVVQPAVTNNIGGLGEALQIARVVEQVVDASDLPLDVDEVLKALRNNLVHFSGNSLDTVLTRYAHFSPTGVFTLKDFVEQNNMVLDFIVDTPAFIDSQYIKLWRAGIRV
ncbi:MAG: hypothetical protein ACO1RX_18870 [Candidatus Sericytochromatia bacterium]